MPLCVEHLSRNIEPEVDLINTNSNKALRPNRYISLLGSIVQGLGTQGVSVLLDFHTLTPKEDGTLWYNENVQEAEYTAAITNLATEMCNSQHWNVIGIELKNAPNDGSWGDGNEQSDWKMAAKKYGEVVLKACPKWLVFVDGVREKRTITVAGETFAYRDFDGAGLQEVAASPLALSVPNKLVYSPHYYTPSKLPQRFFYESGTAAGALLEDFEEIEDDEELKARVKATMTDMFGYLTGTDGVGVVLASFGGIVGDEDEHPLKTSSRVMQYIIEEMVSEGYIGGYLASLNPSTPWKFNPADSAGNFEFGLLETTWRTARTDLLAAAVGMNELSGLDFVQCLTE